MRLAFWASNACEIGRMSGVLLCCPQWSVPSEVFIARHIQMLSETDVLRAIVTSDPNAPSRAAAVPVLRIGPRLWQRALHRLGAEVGWELQVSRQPAAQFARVLRKTGADTVLCEYGTYAVDLLATAEDIDAKLFVHVHGYDTTEGLCPPKYRERLVHLSRRATIICNSQESRRRVLAWGVGPERVVVKYCGVRVPDAPLERPARRSITILHLGRLVDCKSPDRTIRAFELACERGLEGRLVVAGDGPLRTICELLRVRSRWRERIDIVGVVSPVEAARLYSEADIFTLHSIQGELTGQIEAFSVAVVEAMATALPVVACRIGGVIETVVDGETGILLDPGDVEAQARAFVRLAEDLSLRRSLGEAGWRRAKARFSWEIERAELLRILGMSEGLALGVTDASNGRGLARE
jgi:colanic acid/amylovoran biosynthesis glycosyltransferase